MSNQWLLQFRQISKINKSNAQYWFWDHFDWKTNSLWIGKFNQNNHLPQTDDQIIQILNKLLKDISDYKLDDTLYIKFYLSRNVNTHCPELNYLMICDHTNVPEIFSNTLTDVLFDRCQITECFINDNTSIKNLINHYISWNNFYTYYDLMGEVHN